jgi:hypothetical protein
MEAICLVLQRGNLTINLYNNFEQPYSERIGAILCSNVHVLDCLDLKSALVSTVFCFLGIVVYTCFQMP